MRLLFLVLLCGTFIASCAATITAVEARRLSDRRSFRTALVFALPSSAATLALAIIGAVLGYYGLPGSDHLGFGPDWHCLGSGPKSAAFCLRDVPGRQER